MIFTSRILFRRSWATGSESTPFGRFVGKSGTSAVATSLVGLISSKFEAYRLNRDDILLCGIVILSVTKKAITIKTIEFNVNFANELNIFTILTN